MPIFDNIVLSVVEGLTEYLPISSTGHIIIASWLLGINEENFVKDFTVMVQFGAILAVLFLYWRRFIISIEFYKKISVSVIPAIVIGLLVKNKIDIILGSVWIVAIALILGGLFIIWYERRQKNVYSEVDFNENHMTYKQALLIGLIQCLAFIPGVSRAAASIFGGLHVGLSRKAAAEFSFFLAVPTLVGASFIKFIKIWPSMTADMTKSLLLGNAISFIVGAITIKLFVGFLSRNTFKVFGYYRIVLGTILIIFLML